MGKKHPAEIAYTRKMRRRFSITMNQKEPGTGTISTNEGNKQDNVLNI
jgi:deoxyribodipyrimidine photolyase-like uncharacterized protein